MQRCQESGKPSKTVNVWDFWTNIGNSHRAIWDSTKRQFIDPFGDFLSCIILHIKKSIVWVSGNVCKVLAVKE